MFDVALSYMAFLAHSFHLSWLVHLMSRLLFSNFIFISFVCCVYVNVCVCTLAHALAQKWRSEDNFQKSGLTLWKQSLSHSFYCCTVHSRLPGLWALAASLSLPPVSLHECWDDRWTLTSLPGPDLPVLFPQWSTMSIQFSPMALSFTQGLAHSSNVGPFGLL